MIDILTTSQRIGSLWFFSRVFCRSVSPKFKELCMETPCLCPCEGHKHGGRKVTETSLTKLRNIIALVIRHIEIPEMLPLVQALLS